MSVIHAFSECDKSIAIGTIIISQDMRKRVRQNYRMSYELLLTRIKERLDVLGLSERKACMMADVGLNTIRHIRARGHAPKPENLAKLAKVLEVPAAYLLEAAAEAKIPAADHAGGQSDGRSHVGIETVYVKGYVQAGTWQEALEWPVSDWKPVYIPHDNRYPENHPFALEVRGSSMDKVYPDGSVIIAVTLDDLGRMPRSGERVVVLKRAGDGTGYMEATVKKYQIDNVGRHILWPESHDPTHQAPIILDELAQKIGQYGHDADHAGCCDLTIHAVVIGSYRPE